MPQSGGGAPAEANAQESDPQSTPTYSLITVTYNSARALQRYGRAIADNQIEWIVVDNASSDGSAEIARSLGAHVIALDKNIGFGAANNVALKMAQGQIVGVVNPDVAIDVADLGIFREILETTNALVAPQLLNDDGTEQPNGRGLPTLVNKVINRLSPDRARRRGFQLFAAPGERVRVTWLTGAAIFARRSTWKDLGGFDEDFFVYYEDVDLCLRAGEKNLPSLIVGDVRWVHGWAREASGVNFKGWRLEGRSAWTFYSKHPGLAIRGDRAKGSRAQ
jgi:N-acetylglucosaminyl-diphospho-decaprenol L-rhamnosyltransferase